MKKTLGTVITCMLCLCMVFTTVFYTKAVVANSQGTALLGDVNHDNSVDNLDAVKVLMYDVGIINDLDVDVADVNSDTYIDNLDAVLILMYDAGINDTVSGKEESGSTESSGNSEDSSNNDSSTITPIDCEHEDTSIINRVDATVDEDGYSGDIYCNLCKTTISNGITLEKFPMGDGPLIYYTYTNTKGRSVTVPSHVDVFEYTLKRANKIATSEFADTEAEILRLINIERQNGGLSPLKNEPLAYYFAKIRAEECKESFSHTRPNGESCFTVFDEEDVFCNLVGENLAYSVGYTLDEIPSLDVVSWMNSPGHRANIMNPNYTSTSIAVVFNPQTRLHYAVQFFFGKD